MSGTKMVLRNCENKKYKRKIGEKAHKIKGKWLVSVGKRYPDLSLNSKQRARRLHKQRVPGSLTFRAPFQNYHIKIRSVSFLPNLYHLKSLSMNLIGFQHDQKGIRIGFLYSLLHLEHFFVVAGAHHDLLFLSMVSALAL